MSNSSLVDVTIISPNRNSPRNDSIKKITIHHMAGNLTVEQCGNLFAKTSRAASSNYGIGTDGRVGMYVEEKDRSWCSSSPSNDHQAITIEVANDTLGGDWHVSDVALNKLILLCADICKRNGIKELNFTGDTSGNLTMHKWFANTVCPGPYLESKFPYIAESVNKILNGEDTSSCSDVPFIYTTNGSTIYKEPSSDSTVCGNTGTGSFTIVEVSSNGFGKLKSGAGWIYVGNGSIWDSDGPWVIEGATGSDKTKLKNLCEELNLKVSSK